MWHRGEPEVAVSPLGSYHDLAVAMADLGDCHPGGPIRLLTGDNTPAMGRIRSRCTEAYPSEESISCNLSQDAFSSCRLGLNEHMIQIRNIVVETVE